MSTAGAVAVRIVLSIGGWITAFSAFATVLGVYRRESEFEVFTLVIAVSAGFAAAALWPSSDARTSANPPSSIASSVAARRSSRSAPVSRETERKSRRSGWAITSG